MPADLASLLSGNDPTAQEQAQAYEQQRLAELQLARPNMGIFAGLNNALAMNSLGQVPGLVGDVAQQKVAAQPDLASAMAAPHPYQYMAANPGMNPIARAQLLSGATPEASAQLRKTLADAALLQAQGGLAQWQLQQRQNPTVGRSGYNTAPPGAGGGAIDVSAGAGGGGAAPASAPGAVLPPGSLGSGRYGAPATGGGLGAIPPPGPARMAWLARLTPQQRALLLGRLPAAPGAAPDVAVGR